MGKCFEMLKDFNCIRTWYIGVETDYTSTMFDFGTLKRPIIFFAYDLDNYRDSLRGFYFDLEEKAPGPIVKTTDEVVEALLDIYKVNENYSEKQAEFYDKFCHLDDGYAAKRVVDRVFKKKSVEVHNEFDKDN